MDDGGIDQAALQLFIPSCGIQFDLLARGASSVWRTLLESRLGEVITCLEKGI